MLIVMKPDASASEISRVLEIIETLGFRPHAMPGETRTAIGITGNKGSVDSAHFENLPGVADAIRVTSLTSLFKDLRPEKSLSGRQRDHWRVGLAIVAGPCGSRPSIKCCGGRGRIKERCKFFRAEPVNPGHALRVPGQGETPKDLSDVRARFGLNIVTEGWMSMARSRRKIRRLHPDRARNMQNFSLLKSRGKPETDPFETGPFRHADEFLLAAEYVMAEGTTSYSLRTRHSHLCRSRSEYNGPLYIPAVHRFTHLPIIATRRMARDITICHAPARAGVAVGATG